MEAGNQWNIFVSAEGKYLSTLNWVLSKTFFQTKGVKKADNQKQSLPPTDIN